MPESLLPRARTPYEAALSLAIADAWRIPAEILSTVYDPLTCPEKVLPYLARTDGVALWKDTWSVEKRRSVAAAWPAITRMFGTRAGYEACLAIVGAELVDMLTPPQGLFVGPELTKEQWDAFIASLPQIRVQLGIQEGTAEPFSLYLDDGFIDDGFVTLDRGAELYGRRAVLRKGGTDTPLEVSSVVTTAEARTAVDYEAVALDGLCPDGLILDYDYLDHCFIDVVARAPQTVTYALDRSYVHADSALQLTILDPGLQPTDTRYVRESDTADAGLSLFLDDGFLDDGFVGPDDAGQLLADVFYLNDPDVTVPVVEAFSWIGQSRIAAPLFTTELMVKAERQQRFGELILDHSFIDDAFILDDDLTLVEDALEAVAAARLGRDKLLVTFQTTRARTFGDGLPLDGSVTFASRVPVAL